MKTRIVPFASLLLAALMAAQAQAQTPSPATLAEGLAKCRVIAQPDNRLACFDALAGPPAGSGRWGAPRAGEGGTGSANTAAAAPAAVAATSPERAFGLEQANANRLEAIESSIVGPFEGWKARQRLRLANGQLWEITDGSSAFYLTIRDPKVKITRGAIGGFFMEIESVNQKPRVKRVE